MWTLIRFTDYTGDMYMLLVPVTAWLRKNQPDIMTTDALHVTQLGEQPEPEPVIRPMELYLNGELVSHWDE